MPQETILVTGATGFAGGHLLDRLADRAPLIAWCRPGGRQPDPARHLDWQPVDLLDAADVERAFEEATPTQVFHVAGAPAVASSFATSVPHLQTNVLGTHHLLEAIRRSARPCRVLVVSSAQIYQTSDDPIDEDAPLVPATPYGLSKLAQDRLADRAWRDDDLDIVIARPFNHAGPRQTADFVVASFARQIARIELGLTAPELRVGNLDARRDMTDVRDVVEAYDVLMAAAPAGRPFNICSGRAWKVADLLDELLHTARVPIRVTQDPALLRPIDVPVVQGDAARLRAELGWAPRIPVEQMLSDTLEWWRGRTRQELTTRN
jgi:GDP-4-dehydro-6-deoxy-D-mannose reductase